MHNVGTGPFGIVFNGTFADNGAAYRMLFRDELTLNKQRYPLAEAVRLARSLNLDYGRKAHKPMWRQNSRGKAVRIGY